jgi:hypothetical protein
VTTPSAVAYRFPALRNINWDTATEEVAHQVLHDVLEHLKDSDDPKAYHQPVFQHVLPSQCPLLDQLVLAEIKKKLGSATDSQGKRFTPKAKQEYNAEVYSQWKHLKSHAPYGKLSGPGKGDRKATTCDHPEMERIVKAREAKDLVRVLQGSIVAQSTLANEARSFSGIGSGVGCGLQAMHADEEHNINAPMETKGHHKLCDNAHFVSLGAIRHQATIQVVIGSHVLMEVRPVPSASV